MVTPLENPILTKELRTRMRGARAFWILFVFLGVLSGILAAAYYSWWRYNSGESYGPGSSFTLGRQFYQLLFVVQAALVGLITPALTSGALSTEREQRTFEALSVTILPRRTIVLGKLISALAFVILLLVGSLPLTAVCFLLGGVSPQEIAAAYLLLAAAGFLYGATGLAFSSFAKTTSAATVLTYGTILTFFLVSLPFSMASGVMGGGGNAVPLVAVNPVGAMAAGTVMEPYFGFHLPAWFTALTVNGLLGVILTLTAIHRLEWPRSDRSAWLRGLTGLFFLWISFLMCGYCARNGRFELESAAMVFSLFPLVLVPLFATGDSLPKGRLRDLLLRPARLLRGEATSGLTFAALTVALSGLFLFTGNAEPGALALGIVLPLAVTFGFGALGLALSQKLGNRWGAMALTIGAMLLAYLLPFGIAITSSMNQPTPHGLWENSYYITPVFGANLLNDRYWSTETQNALIFGRDLPPALITSLLYAAMGAVLTVVLKRMRRSA